ncbi:MAG: hypothetical protein A2075_09100 [Geobacteraceae bacterium GWC2_58_44]|nr:MAG: hypothetical protein A2075_09100 [Geobacteraceae bacterium GWC2_58_44]HBG07670.1 hypothetical protein [Geobacter sp.]
MADTVEQDIVDALVALVGAVDGIETAVDGRVTPFNDPEMPAANVFTPKTETAPAGTMQVDHELAVSIVLYLTDRTAQKAIRSLVAKVYAAIGQAEQNPDGPLGIPAVISINDPAKAVKCIQQGDFIGSAQIALNITYRTARWAM